MPTDCGVITLATVTAPLFVQPPLGISMRSSVPAPTIMPVFAGVRSLTKLAPRRDNVLLAGMVIVPRLELLAPLLPRKPIPLTLILPPELLTTAAVMKFGAPKG